MKICTLPLRGASALALASGFRGDRIAFAPPDEGGGLALLTKALEDNNEAISKRLEEVLKKSADRDDHIDERLDEIERKANRLGLMGGGRDEGGRTLGAIVTKSDAYRDFAKAGYSGKHRVETKAAITSAPTSAGVLVAPDRQTEIVPLPRRELSIRNLLNVKPTTSNLITITRQKSRTINAAVVAEMALKPESAIDWEEAEFPVVTIAHWIPVAKQIFEDAPQLEAAIDSELTYGLKLVEETEIFLGSGTPGHLSGIYVNAAAFVNPLTGYVPQTMIDTLALAMLQAELAGYPATGIVLNPKDWTRATLLKDGDGRYLLGDPATGAPPSLWGRSVVKSEAIPEDKFLVGAFGTAAQLFDRELSNVQISDQDRDNFIRNALTVRAEERLALVNRRPDALVKGDLGNVP